jgi:hypothetical protein
MAKSKRARVAPPSEDDVLHFARMIMENDPFKARAPMEEDSNFRALFGCCSKVVLDLWVLLEENDLVPEDGTMLQLLWTLTYCKTYPKWSTMRKITGKDPKTLRKWIDLFLQSIEQLESIVVSAGISVLK